MERKQVGGNSVDKTEQAVFRLTETAQGEVEPKAGPKQPRKRPSLKVSRLRYCRKLVSHKVAEAMPDIVDALVDKVKDGSVEHTKHFLKLASAEQKNVVPEAPKRRGKGFAQRLLEELRSRQQSGEPGPVVEAASEGPAND
jgi:hypothetical protein